MHNRSTVLSRATHKSSKIRIQSNNILICCLKNAIAIVNGHRKQQLSHTENQQNTVSFSNFIDARLTYSKRCMAVLTGALRTSGPQR